ncbi:NADH dehydrogenase [ubiquinone] 1 beta subcomplex subunit 3 [Diabrotica virgifera virgifera]|uniref:NADH dehydrogenase [ubiquinone] 1 beta subcomplex subunit 3 n=1 Tax=Diabrotica virgifera virgifera TaxID=50390 RepID=A0ABM5JMZ0_DIAVI|nr:NADH dehydrogenase [ubiquinone] 1 beta subcomplex subunit 3 [Diabrotica virgifera virgifera]XP_050499309.1 NADH dehydrogenase [ubiquinone] 1 beta subcomplex subunit 3 [Diabrotica virgifera virgifera]
MGGDGHGHGHGHGPPYTVPDYRIYKVKDVPELLATERALSAHGLKDPWLRNEVWRYNPKEFGTHSSRLNTLVFRGFKLGFGAFVATVIGTAIYDKMNPSDHGHGHGHH